ncbi:hypothetical protein [Streptomyces sp. MAI_2237]
MEFSLRGGEQVLRVTEDLGDPVAALPKERVALNHLAADTHAGR